VLLVYRAQMAEQPSKTSTSMQIEKLVFGGQGLAHADGRTFFVWGGLPAEQVDANVVRRRGGVSEAVVTSVTKPSSDRVEPRESHYLSCSPWQILSAQAEHDWKIKTAQEAFTRIGHLELPKLELVGPSALEEHYGYRNKMEFSFVDVAAGTDNKAAQPDSKKRLSLAFFERATHQRLAIDGCVLARPEIARAADALLAWLRKSGVSAAQLKTLILRSDGERVVAGLFVMEREADLFGGAEITLDDLKELGLAGFALIYSDPRSPVSRVDDVLSKVGSLELSQKVGERTLAYGLESFFQVNVRVFEQALDMMREFVYPQAPMVDLYSGVGSIGISLVKPGQHLTLVESHPEAVEFARQNVKAAGVLGTTVLESTSEKALHAVTPDATIIVDPPRVGLHARVTQRLIAVLPKKIVYLSCNVSTQARDLALLLPHYRIVAAKLFNFFPRTPHVESLVFLDRF
jgi:23S rRNA (uracil1939-C5)-methyltransferase